MGKPFFPKLVDVVAPQRQDEEMEREGVELREQQHRHLYKPRNTEYKEVNKKRYNNNPESMKKAISASVESRRKKYANQVKEAMANHEPGTHVFVRINSNHNRNCAFCGMWESVSWYNVKNNKPNKCPK